MMSNPSSERQQDWFRLFQTSGVALLLSLAALWSVGLFGHQAVKRVLEATGFCDYAHFYVFGRLLLEKQNVYALSDAEIAQIKAAHLQDYPCGEPNHSPALNYFFSLFYLPDYKASLTLFCIFIILVTVSCVLLILPGCGYPVHWGSLFLAAFLLFSQNSLVETFALGQTTALVLLLLILCLFLLRHKHPLAAGVMLGLLALIKINFSPVAGIFLVTQRWKAALAATVTYLGITGATVFLVGKNTMAAYIQKAFRRIQGAHEYSSLDCSLTNTVHGLLDTIAHPARTNLANIIVIFVAGFLTAVAAWVAFRHRQTASLNILFALAVTTIVLINPLMQIPYLMLLFLPLVVLFGEVMPQADRQERILFVAAFSILSIGFSFGPFPAFHHGFLILVANAKLWATLALWLLLLRHTARSNLEFSAK